MTADTQTNDQHARRRWLLLVVGLSVLIASAAIAPATAVADDDPLDDLIDEEEDTEQDEDSGLFSSVGNAWDTVRSAGSGVAAGLSNVGDRINPFSEPADLDAEANETVETINSNDEAIADYWGTHSWVNESYAVHRVDLVREGDDGDTVETFYVVAEDNGSTGTVDNVFATRDLGDNRTVDQHHRLYGSLAENTADETQRFVDEFVTEDEAPDQTYVAELTGTYGADALVGEAVESSMTDDGFEGVTAEDS